MKEPIRYSFGKHGRIVPRDEGEGIVSDAIKDDDSKSKRKSKAKEENITEELSLTEEE